MPQNRMSRFPSRSGRPGSPLSFSLTALLIDTVTAKASDLEPAGLSPVSPQPIFERFESAAALGLPILIFRPGRESKTPPPVLVFLHERGENGSDGLRQVSNNFGYNFYQLQDVLEIAAVMPQMRVGDGIPLDRIRLAVLDACDAYGFA